MSKFVMKTVSSRKLEFDLKGIVLEYPEKDWAQYMAEDSVAFYEACVQLLKSKGLKPTSMRISIEMDGE